MLDKYQDLIREKLKGRHGIYALYKRDSLYYVGLASNMRNRLKKHLNDRHTGKWDRFSIYLVVEGHHIRELESLVLRIVQPKANRQIGKLKNSKDLKRELERELKQRLKREISEMMGKKRPYKKARKPKSRKALAEDGKGVLAPYLVRRMQISATYKGCKYKATARKDGWVRYGDYLYRSPSMAAKAIVKRNINGWNFWKYRNDKGEWVKLNQLR